MYSAEELKNIQSIIFAKANFDENNWNFSFDNRKNLKEIETFKFICLKSLLANYETLSKMMTCNQVIEYLLCLKQSGMLCDFVFSTLSNYDNFYCSDKNEIQPDKPVFDHILGSILNKLAENISEKCPQRNYCVNGFCVKKLNYFVNFEDNILINDVNLKVCYDFRKIRPFLLKNFFEKEDKSINLDFDKILSYLVGNMISKIENFNKLNIRYSPEIIYARQNLYDEICCIHRKKYTLDNIQDLKKQERELALLLNVTDRGKAQDSYFSIGFIDGLLKLLYTLTDGDCRTFDNLARIFAEVFLGSEVLVKEKIKHNNVVVFTSNNNNFVYTFLNEFFNYCRSYYSVPLRNEIIKENGTEYGLKNIVEYNKRIDYYKFISEFEKCSHNEGLRSIYDKHFLIRNGKIYPTTSTNFPLNKLCESERIGLFIEYKSFGCIVNYSILNSGQINLSQFKKMVQGKEVIYHNYYLGTQKYKSNLKYIFISKNDKDYSVLDNTDISYDLIGLSRNLPEDEYVNLGFLSNFEKEILYNNFIRYGLNLLYSKNNDCRERHNGFTVKELIKLFFDKCCNLVPYNEKEDKPTELNATALKTLNVGFNLFCAKLNNKNLSTINLKKEIISQYNLMVKPMERTKSTGIIKRDINSGFYEDEVFTKNGGTHWLGVIIKSKDEILRVAEEVKNTDNYEQDKKELNEFIEYVVDKLRLNISRPIVPTIPIPISCIPLGVSNDDNTFSI